MAASDGTHTLSLPRFDGDEFRILSETATSSREVVGAGRE